MIVQPISRALQALALAMLFLAGSASVNAAGYFAQGGKIYSADGQEIQLRGISHFGFNSMILQPAYLWQMGWKEQIAQIKSLGFNAVRVPFAPDTLYNNTPIDRLSYLEPRLNPEFIGKTPLQALDLWMAEANRQGLYIMLDFHGVSRQRQYPTWFVSNPADFGLTYNGQAYTPANWTRDLAFVAQRYANLPYFFAIDIFNEPNSIVRWSSGDASVTDPAYFWKSAAESAAAAILRANPNLLIFVQGITANSDGIEKANVPINWGENFQPQAYQPLAIPLNKLVLSPHTYGPDGYLKTSFRAANFPANLAADWETLFGQFSQAHPVIVGEWGGRYGNGPAGHMDVAWQNAFVDYLLSKGIRSGFYWCYTPNSGDTGGILDDNLNVRQDKMALLRRLWGDAAPAAEPPPAILNISNFSPTSGPIGTVVTINGTGFTSAHHAWIGQAHNANALLVSDTQIKVWVPRGSTTSSIGIFFTPTQVAFTPTAFTVTSAAPVYHRPRISGFSPQAGPVGTVVTVSGEGFTGVNRAIVGGAQNARVLVISDTEVRVTMPARATTGRIALYRPPYSAMTTSSFQLR